MPTSGSPVTSTRSRQMRDVLEMIPVEEAFRIMDETVPGNILSDETIPVRDAVGRVLFEDQTSRVDMPPFNKSAMDGFACRISDIDLELEIIETIPAGKSPQNKIEPGQCAKIMTGAPVPEGADCVIMIEDAEVTDNKIKILHKPDKSNICIWVKISEREIWYFRKALN